MKLSISLKIVFIAALSVVVSSVIILCISTILFGNHLTHTRRDEISTMQSIVAKMHEHEEARLLQNMGMLTNMPQLVDALHELDAVKMKEIAVMVHRQLGIDSVLIADARGIAVCRGHSDRVGDDVSVRPIMASALKGFTNVGVLFGDSAVIPFTIRCVAPVYKDNVLAGILSLASDMGTVYVDNLQEISGMHFTLYKDNTIVMTTIKGSGGERIIGAKFEDAQVADKVLNKGERVVVRGETFGEPDLTAFWPAKDFDKNIVGMWAITMLLTKQNNETHRVLMIIVFCSLGIMLFFILAAVLLGNRIILPIRKVIDYAVEVAGGNLDIPIDVQSNDEVELLVSSLKTMVATLKERIQEAERQHMEADAANKAKSAFLSTMSHEIRTPMNAILGITEIQLQYETLGQNIKDAFEKIYTSGYLLLGIINDILDLSKIEAGKLELVINKYEIASMISDTAQLNIMRIGSKPLEFELYVDENMPSFMLGDELRVKQILNNLLSNAFKYTAAGTVKMTVTAEAPSEAEAGALAGEKDDKVVLVVTVSDTGQGMTKDQIDRLFDEYTRFNLNANRSTEGTGLGMSITRKLVMLMNGDILVESESGKGSAFTIRLVQGRSEPGVLGKEMAENLHQFRTHCRVQMRRVQISREPMPYGNVLIVDDVETNIYVAKGLLAPYELKTDSANSGYAAIDKIKNGKVYDIVFMDHMMPQMDGIEATKIIRDMGYNEPIVALTANAVAGQAGVFLENGFNDFISKPIDIRQMNLVLNKLIRDKQPPEVLEAARQHAKIRKELSGNMPLPAVDAYLAEIFVRDASKSLAMLRKIIEKNGMYDENDMRMYIIHTHGIKSALANIGKMDLCAVALRLEQSGRDKDVGVIKAETPAFITSLQAFVEELKSMNNKASGKTPEPGQEEPLNPPSEEDIANLRERLFVIKTACENYDENTADRIVTELRKRLWPEPVKELLDTINDHLLHSDFDEISNFISKFINNDSKNIKGIL